MRDRKDLNITFDLAVDDLVGKTRERNSADVGSALNAIAVRGLNYMLHELLKL